MPESKVVSWQYPAAVMVCRGHNDKNQYGEWIALFTQCLDGSYFLFWAPDLEHMEHLFTDKLFRRAGNLGGMTPKPADPYSLAMVHNIIRFDPAVMVRATPHGIPVDGCVTVWVSAEQGGLCPLVFSLAGVPPQGAILFPLDPLDETW